MKSVLSTILAASILLLALVSCGGKHSQPKNKSGFELKGKLEFSNGEQLYLEEIRGPQDVKVIDTASLNSDGAFSFENSNPKPGFYRLRITEANFATLVLDSTQKVFLKGDARNLGNTYSVEGSADSRLFTTVNNTIRLSYQKRDSIMRSAQAYVNMNKNDKAKIREFADRAQMGYSLEAKLLNDYLISTIQKNPGSLVAVVTLPQLSTELSKGDYLELYGTVDEAVAKKYPGSEQAKLFHETYSGMLKTRPGALAPEFQAESVDGKKMGPSKFKGKVLILDFWASWCRPCREESPNMVRLYQKYHPKGLEILSISLDKDRDKWKEAILHDKLEWNHVSDLDSWQSPIARLYNVTSIPQTYLLDKEGFIISKGLRSDSLDACLRVLLR